MQYLTDPVAIAIVAIFTAVTGSVSAVSNVAMWMLVLTEEARQQALVVLDRSLTLGICIIVSLLAYGLLTEQNFLSGTSRDESPALGTSYTLMTIDDGNRSGRAQEPTRIVERTVEIQPVVVRSKKGQSVSRTPAPRPEIETPEELVPEAFWGSQSDPMDVVNGLSADTDNATISSDAATIGPETEHPAATHRNTNTAEARQSCSSSSLQPSSPTVGGKMEQWPQFEFTC